MNHSDERDHDEERYNRDLCPLCDHSPCRGGRGKGSCEASFNFTYDNNGAKWTPWTDGRYAVGFKVTAEGMPDRIVKLYPDAEDSFKEPIETDVRIYLGNVGDEEFNSWAYIWRDTPTTTRGRLDAMAEHTNGEVRNLGGNEYAVAVTVQRNAGGWISHPFGTDTLWLAPVEDEDDDWGAWLTDANGAQIAPPTDTPVWAMAIGRFGLVDYPSVPSRALHLLHGTIASSKWGPQPGNFGLPSDDDLPHVLHDAATDELIGPATPAQVAAYHPGAYYEGIGLMPDGTIVAVSDPDSRAVYAVPAPGVECQRCKDIARELGADP